MRCELIDQAIIQTCWTERRRHSRVPRIRPWKIYWITYVIISLGNYGRQSSNPQWRCCWAWSVL